MTRIHLEQLSLRYHVRRHLNAANRSEHHRSRRLDAVRLVLHQTRFDLRSFSRDKQARFTTLALPVVLLVAFVSVGGGNKTFVQDGQTIKTAVFFVPGLIALAVISASFSNLLTDLVAQRDSGVLKRRRATPVPAFAPDRRPHSHSGRDLARDCPSAPARWRQLLRHQHSKQRVACRRHHDPVRLRHILGARLRPRTIHPILDRDPANHPADPVPPLRHLRRAPTKLQEPTLAERGRKRPTAPTPRPRTAPRLRPNDARHRAEHRRSCRPQRLVGRGARPRYPKVHLAAREWLVASISSFGTPSGSWANALASTSTKGNARRVAPIGGRPSCVQ